jgi:hypothetical protein
MTARRDVLGVILIIAAVTVGLWLGLAGPDISPVFTEAPGQRGGDEGFRR